MKALIALNPAVPGNYSFVCPEAPLCLNPINRQGYTNVVTPSILRGLQGRTLIDVDNVIDVEAGVFIEEDKPTILPEVEEPAQVEKPQEEPQEEVQEEVKPKASARTKKSAK